uniref:Uncharacterized protein n=1 Tax=Musa acuminata subsp. malaccensis TaxID=214687 RepID=A0A804KNF1_MUSAM
MCGIKKKKKREKIKKKRIINYHLCIILNEFFNRVSIL